jgi:peptidoglycan/xylan/chitin deacetylase (PgdA/CDA1 family)
MSSQIRSYTSLLTAITFRLIFACLLIVATGGCGSSNPISPSPSAASPDISTTESPAHDPTSTPPQAPQPAPQASVGGLVTISIDDGWRSTYDNAFPILDAVGFKTTNYIITGRLNHPEFLGASEILSLEARGHEIGAHTRGHLELTKLPEEQAKFEVMISKQDLLRAGVRSVRSFAYPFGAYNNRLVQAVREAGYTSARTTDKGFDNTQTDPFVLRYQELGGSTSLAQVKSWVDETITTRQWLILLAHHIDGTVSDFSITPQFFQEVVNYLVSKRVRVVTISQGLQMTP